MILINICNHYSILRVSMIEPPTSSLEVGVSFEIRNKLKLQDSFDPTTKKIYISTFLKFQKKGRIKKPQRP